MKTPALKKIRVVESPESSFLTDVLDGLGRKQKSLPSKYFYDDAGSRLFEEICRLEEYYLYRTELQMLPAVSREVAGIIQGDIDVVEPGAGALDKIRILLQHHGGVRRYIPIDISGEYLRKAAAQLDQEFSNLEVVPVAGDFTSIIQLPDKTEGVTRLGFPPGSTIGNFPPPAAIALLERFRKSLGEDSRLLIGVDTKKSTETLHRAYNDSAGVTAKFNKNLLLRINRELDGTFAIEQFEHYAFYNVHEGRIEMHLVSLMDQKVSVNGIRFSFKCGESIHTENSYKYSAAEFSGLVMKAGWNTERQWQDENSLFSHYLLRAEN
jgi:dimethylhistidine N-methyltransferase